MDQSQHHDFRFENFDWIFDNNREIYKVDPNSLQQRQHLNLQLHLDELDRLLGVGVGEGGEVSGLLDDGVVPVERTGDCVRTTGVMTGLLAREAVSAGTHVVRVGETEVMVKHENIKHYFSHLTGDTFYPCFSGKYSPWRPTPRCHLRKTS